MEGSIYTVNAVCECHHFVPVKGDIGTGGPFQFAIRIPCVYREFMTPKTDLSDVVIVVTKTGFLRNLYTIQQVSGGFIIIIIYKLDTVIKQTQIKPDIKLLGSFPTQIGVRQGAYCSAWNHVVIENIVHRVVDQSVLGIIPDVIVTGHADASPNLSER